MDPTVNAQLLGFTYASPPKSRPRSCSCLCQGIHELAEAVRACSIFISANWRPMEVVYCSSDSTNAFDCPQEALPEKLKVLLCLVDGAKRRRQIQAKLNVLHPRADGE